MILHLLCMRRNVNRNDQKNVSATSDVITKETADGAASSDSGRND